MSDRFPQYSNKVQDKTRLKIETMMDEVLDGDRKTQMQNFVAWMRENKLTPSYNSTNKWRVNFKGHHNQVCFLMLSGSRELDAYDFGTWSIRVAYHGNILGKANDENFDNWLKETTWKNIGKCRRCNNTCPVDGHTIDIFGKEFTFVCGTYLNIVNPTDDEIVKLKKQLLLIKNCVLCR